MTVIIDTAGSNLNSVLFALNRLGVEVKITSDPQQIQQAERVFLPGVGHAEAAMRRLHEAGLAETICGLKQPVLGICLGMQILFEQSQEGQVDTLGILPGTIQAFDDKGSLPVPHMGWNKISRCAGDPLFQGIQEGAYFYFVHSYFAPVSAMTIGQCDYLHVFSAAVRRKNFWGVQFHPEKSDKTGLKVLKNFMEIQ